MKNIESKKRKKYFSTPGTEKAVEYENDGNTDCNRYTRNGPQRLLN